MSADVALNTVAPDAFAEFANNAHMMGTPQPQTGAVMSVSGPNVANDPVYDTSSQTVTHNGQLMMDVRSASLMPGVDENNDPSIQVQAPDSMLSIGGIMDGVESIKSMVQKPEPAPQPMFIPTAPELPAVQTTYTPTHDAPSMT